jgi:hypothetical protein
LRDNNGRFVKGHKHSKTTIKKMSEKLKGRKAWNNGLTKETDERVNKNAEKTKKTRKRLIKEGKIVNGNKGKFGKESGCWRGGSRMYFQKVARTMCEKAGWDIKGKIIHHKNGDFRDNRLDNFQILMRGEHTKLHKPQQFRKNWKAWNKGVPHTEEHKQKLKEAWKKRKGVEVSE